MQCKDLQEYLEDVFSMPFCVSVETQDGDDVYLSYPKNEDQAFFEVRTRIKNNIRVIVEIEPQKYAAQLLREMSYAPNDKKKLFFVYYEALRCKQVKFDFKINGSLCSQIDDSLWKDPWKQLYCRFTRVPVIDLNDEYDESFVVCEWTKQAYTLFFSLLNIVDADFEHSGKEEGNCYQVVANRYERNPINRELCLAKKGYACGVCGFDFKTVYGIIGQKFIHVHHLIPVSKMGPNYVVNPVEDLIPVCPNCHAMLHRKDPPYTPEEMRDILSINKIDS